jgi:hypothetical protein
MDKKLKKKIISIIILIVLIVVAVLVFVYKPTEITPELPPSPDYMEEADVAAYLDSDKFNNLSAEERLGFLDKIPANQKAKILNKHIKNANDEKSRRQMRNLMNSYLQGRVEQFFSASEDEQNAMIDQDIERFNKAQAIINWQIRMSGKKQIVPKDGAERAEFDASISPATKAKVRIYLEKMRQRKKQLGIK